MTKPVQSYAAVKAPKPNRADPRRAPDKLAFICAQRCLCWSLDPEGCRGRVTVHHVRIRGGQRLDARTVPLCVGHHTSGPRSLHVLGRKRFEREHRLDTEREAAFYEQKFQHGRVLCDLV